MDNSQQYYLSHSKLPFIGTGGQSLLANAKVLVIGAGGLGCPCLLTLAGCGIGTIGVVDFDTVSITNLHRQTLFNFDHIGYHKTLVAKEVLELHNPYITVNEHAMLVSQSNILELLTPYDIIVDCTDNFEVRYLINDACVYLNKPLVYGAIYRTEGHSTVFNYSDSATLRCLFPEPDVAAHVPNCADVGAYNVVTNVIGNLMGNEAVKIILGQDDVLSNTLAIYDALSVTINRVRYKADPTNKQISCKRFQQAERPIHILPENLKILAPESYYLIDVRESWEREEHHIGGEHIPLNQLNHHDFSFLSRDSQIIVYCQQGQRSEVAAKLLRKLGFENVLSLHGGLNALLK